MKPEVSLRHSQVPANSPYPQPARSSPCPTSHFLNIHLNIVLQYTPGFSKCSVLSHVSLPNPVHASLLPYTFYFLLLLLSHYIMYKILRKGQQCNYIEPRMLGITNCSLVTILVMLTHLPLLTSSCFVFLVHTMENAIHRTAFVSKI